MSVTQKPFGIDQIGRQMTLYTMTNKAGASVSVLDFGAHLVSIKVPDKNGKLSDVCLGYDTLEEYDQKPSYLGATVGRFGNRIGGSRFTLNGKEYTLFPNDGRNSLHGAGKALTRNGGKAKCWKRKTRTPCSLPMWPTTAKRAIPAKCAYRSPSPLTTPAA